MKFALPQGSNLKEDAQQAGIQIITETIYYDP